MEETKCKIDDSPVSFGRLHNLVEIDKKDFLDGTEDINMNGRTKYWVINCKWHMRGNIYYKEIDNSPIRLPRKTVYHLVNETLSNSTKEKVLIWVTHIPPRHYFAKEVGNNVFKYISQRDDLDILNKYLDGLENWFLVNRPKKRL